MVKHYLSLRYLSLAPTMTMMSNHSYIRIFENEGHQVIFEQALKDGQQYFKLQETFNNKRTETSIMTLDGGYLYMDKLVKRGYIGYN